MRYDTYRYLWPPRPEVAVAPNILGVYESRGWWGQAKMNGTLATIYVPPDRRSFAMGRHGPKNRLLWQPGARWESFQAHLPGKGWYVIVGELLHSRGVGVRDTVYLFDLLVDDGNYLIGTTYRDRLRRLGAICKAFPAASFSDSTHSVIAPGVWLAMPHARAFPEWFRSIRNLPGKPPVEGLVFRDPNAKLAPCGRASANSKGMAKVRVATDHLSF